MSYLFSGLQSLIYCMCCCTQVKVWLGENLDHYYILSRFLICRMLTVTRIPYIKVSTQHASELQGVHHYSIAHQQSNMQMLSSTWHACHPCTAAICAAEVHSAVALFFALRSCLVQWLP
jgi:hypothetical protein